MPYNVKRKEAFYAAGLSSALQKLAISLSPAMTGAGIGAAGGALMGGEGNRTMGALGGAALGAGVGSMTGHTMAQAAGGVARPAAGKAVAQAPTKPLQVSGAGESTQAINDVLQTTPQRAPAPQPQKSPEPELLFRADQPLQIPSAGVQPPAGAWFGDSDPSIMQDFSKFRQAIRRNR